MQLSLMGIHFEKLKKKNFPTDQPIPVKQGRVRESKNILRLALYQAETH